MVVFGDQPRRLLLQRSPTSDYNLAGSNGRVRWGDYSAVSLDPVDGRPPGGESAAEVAARVWAAADDIARDHPDGTVLVVSHGLALATLIARADGVSLEKVYTLIPDNAAIRVLSWPPD